MSDTKKDKKPKPDDVLRRMLNTPPKKEKGKKVKDEDRKKG